MKKSICVVLACLLCVMLIMPAGASSFPDVRDSSDFAGAIEYVNSVGLMVGDDKGNFNPDNPVTRAEMAIIIWRMLDEPGILERTSRFPDVEAQHWACSYIERVTELGIVNGYSNGNFGPNDHVTYEQAVTMMVRTIGAEAEALTLGGYPDGYLNAALAHGLLHNVRGGKGKSITRANIAMLLYNCDHPGSSVAPVTPSQPVQTAKTDLSQYLGTDIDKFFNMIGDMERLDTQGGVVYRKDAITVGPEDNSTRIDYIMIGDSCNYSIHGIECGMPLSEAILIAGSIAQSSLNSTMSDEYLLNDGSTLSLYKSDDGKTVIAITLWSKEFTPVNT